MLFSQQSRSLAPCSSWPRPRRSVGIRIAGRTVETTLVEDEPMEMRIAATTQKVTEGVTLQVSL